MSFSVRKYKISLVINVYKFASWRCENWNTFRDSSFTECPPKEVLFSIIIVTGCMINVRELNMPSNEWKPIDSILQAWFDLVSLFIVAHTKFFKIRTSYKVSCRHTIKRHSSDLMNNFYLKKMSALYAMLDQSSSQFDAFYWNSLWMFL